MEDLGWLSWQYCLSVLVFIDVVDHDLSVFSWDVGHDKVLLESCWQYRESTVVDMFSNDIDATWCPAVECWLDAVKIAEAPRDILVSGFVLVRDRVIDVLIDVCELCYDGYGVNLGCTTAPATCVS